MRTQNNYIFLGTCGDTRYAPGLYLKRKAGNDLESLQLPYHDIHAKTYNDRYSKINVRKIAFGNKENTRDKKMGVSVLLRLFISSNEVCNTAYVL